MKKKFINKLNAGRKFNPKAFLALKNKLQSDELTSQTVNLLINLVYKVKQKLNHRQALKLGRANAPTAKVIYQDTSNLLQQKNLELFPNSIVIVAELSIPQCTKYRVTQKVEMLEYLGKKVAVVSWTDALKTRDLMQTAGIVIFYRVPAFNMVIEYFQLAKHLGITTYYDVDDLIFDLNSLKENSSLLDLNKQDLQGVYESAQLYHDAMVLADFGIASTTKLAECMRAKMNKPVYVVENAVDSQSLQVNEPLQSITERIRIVYGSGTNTHNQDFLEAAGAIVTVMKEFPEVDFVIYGYLELDKRFDDLQHRIFRVPFISAIDYYRSLGSCDIAIAPLAKTIFNDCKSNIKFIESALVNIPCICSPCSEFAKIINHSVNGYLAATENEWYKALVELILNKEKRTLVANRAYREVINTYSWQSIAKNQLLPVLPKPAPKKTRILMVNVLFKPDSFGGATIIAEGVAKSIGKSEHVEVLIFCGTFDSNLQPLEVQRYEVDNITVIKSKLNISQERSTEYNNPAMKEVFARVVTAWEPDLVHFHSIQLLGANIAEICLERKVPYIITLHDAWWFCEKQFMIKEDNSYCANYEGALVKCANCTPDSAFTHTRRFYLHNLMKFAALLLTPSDFFKQLYITSGGSDSQIMVNKNGILPVKKVMVKPNKLNREITFAYLGGKAVHKGYFWLRDIFNQINLTNYTIKLVNIESRLGSAGASLNDWKQIKGKVIITPFFNQETIDDFFSDIDVLLFPSQWKESFGLTIREAMLRDVWVITTDCGGPTEDVVEGINGNITPFEDQEAFKLAIENILNNSHFLSAYKNPYKEKILLIDDQAKHLQKIYTSMLNCKI